MNSAFKLNLAVSTPLTTPLTSELAPPSGTQRDGQRRTPTRIFQPDKKVVQERRLSQGKEKTKSSPEAIYWTRARACARAGSSTGPAHPTKALRPLVCQAILGPDVCSSVPLKQYDFETEWYGECVQPHAPKAEPLGHARARKKHRRVKGSNVGPKAHGLTPPLC